MDEEEEEDPGEYVNIIWGTNIHRSVVASRVRRFLTSFREAEATEAKYVELIRQVRSAALHCASFACSELCWKPRSHHVDAHPLQAVHDGLTKINIDCCNLHDHDTMLYAQLINYPGEVIDVFDERIMAVARELAGEDSQSAVIRARPCKLLSHTSLVILRKRPSPGCCWNEVSCRRADCWCYFSRLIKRATGCASEPACALAISPA